MHSKLREDKPLERSVEQAVWITHRCKRGLWWIAGSGGRCCAFCLSCEEKKQTNANQMRNPSGVVFLFGKHASVQSDSVTVSNIEQSRESALMKRAHQSSHVTLKPASRAAVKTGTMASAPRWSGSSSIWNKPRSICSGHETNLSWSKRKKKKWGMGAARRSAPPPRVNGDMPRPYHTPVICLQCLNDSPTQWQQSPPIPFSGESECGSGVCSHTHTHYNIAIHTPAI